MLYFGQALELLYNFMRKGGTLPGGGLSKVQVVNAVQVHVLGVPWKRALPHPKEQAG